MTMGSSSSRQYDFAFLPTFSSYIMVKIVMQWGTSCAVVRCRTFLCANQMLPDNNRTLN